MFWSRTGRHFALMGAALLLASCTPYNVHTDYDDEVSFSQFRTFAWMDSTRPRGETRRGQPRLGESMLDDASTNPFLERRVKRAVETVMAE